MPISASDIANKALTLMDEQVIEVLAAATTEMTVKEMALDILPEVCRDIIKEFPYELKRLLEKDYTPNEQMPVGQDAYSKKKVILPLPDDFYELVGLKFEAWDRAVTDYILIDDPEYRVQNNPFTRSGLHNPTVAMGIYDSGSFMECFSLKSNTDMGVEYFKYVSFDNVPDDKVDGVRWPDELMDEISKALASQLLVIKGYTEQGLLRGEETQQAIEQHG